MPIYAYKCESCGHRQDLLRKVSDPALCTCPACGAERFAKQVTAAGFQLKGSGWYATDFRGSKPGADEPKGDTGEGAENKGKPDKADQSAGKAGAAAGSAGAAAPAPAASAAKARGSPTEPT